jgi:L-malate glycosyltransferase
MSQLYTPVRTVTADAPAAKGPADLYAPVLIVTPWYYPSVGGVAEVAERLRRGLRAEGVQAHLLVCGEEKRIQPDHGVKNLWRYDVPGSAFSSLTPRAVAANLLRAPGAIWRIFRFLRQQGIRTVILLYPIEYAWPFVVARHLLGIRLVTSLHGDDVRRFDQYNWLLRALFRRLLRSSHDVVVCAEHLGLDAQALCPDVPLPIRVIRNCVDGDHFSPPPPQRVRSAAGSTVVHVSNFAPKKRTPDIVEAFASSHIPADARLVMVGAGRDLEAAVQRARDLGVDDRVQFVGSQKDVRPFLWDADLFVLASEAEGAPLVLLEAMACGVPWVSTPWGAAAELPPGECGLVVPAGEPDRLAAAVGELLRNPARRREMATRARQRAVADYGERQYVKRHLQVLAER